MSEERGPCCLEEANNSAAYASVSHILMKNAGIFPVASCGSQQQLWHAGSEFPFIWQQATVSYTHTLTSPRVSLYEFSRSSSFTEFCGIFSYSPVLITLALTARCGTAYRHQRPTETAEVGFSPLC